MRRRATGVAAPDPQANYYGEKMPTFCGISVDAGVSVDGDCEITHTVTTRDCVEIELGQSAGSLQLYMTEEAATKLVNVATDALDVLRRRRVAADQPPSGA